MIPWKSPVAWIYADFEAKNVPCADKWLKLRKLRKSSFIVGRQGATMAWSWLSPPLAATPAQPNITAIDLPNVGITWLY